MLEPLAWASEHCNRDNDCYRSRFATLAFVLGPFGAQIGCGRVGTRQTDPSGSRDLERLAEVTIAGIKLESLILAQNERWRHA